MEPIVYLPIEIKHREMPSRLVIAAHLLRLGVPVVVGNHWALTSAENQAAFPPGLYLLKTMNKLQGNLMALARRNGHVIAASDEEVLVFTEYNGFITSLAENAAANCAVFFAQSEAHKDAVERRWASLRGRVRVTGNVRIDLLSAAGRAAFEKHDPAVEAAKPYVLFNSNIGSLNSVWAASGRVMAMASNTSPFDAETTARHVDAIVAWEQKNYQAMTALLGWVLGSAKGLNVVVRPHPAERTDNWDAMLKSQPRARMIARSDPHPWIAGAELIVHTGCTTGLEAAFMGKPTINLLPEDHPLCRQIVTEANPTFRTPDAAAQAMAAYLTNRSGPIAAHTELARAAIAKYWPTFDAGGADSAARLIAEALKEELAAHGAVPRGNFDIRWRRPFTDVLLQDIQRDKFSTSPDEVIGMLRKATGLVGYAGQIGFSQIGDGLFLLTPA